MRPQAGSAGIQHRRTPLQFVCVVSCLNVEKSIAFSIFWFGIFGFQRISVSTPPRKDMSYKVSRTCQTLHMHKKHEIICRSDFDRPNLSNEALQFYQNSTHALDGSTSFHCRLRAGCFCLSPAQRVDYPISLRSALSISLCSAFSMSISATATTTSISALREICNMSSIECDAEFGNQQKIGLFFNGQTFHSRMTLSWNLRNIVSA